MAVGRQVGVVARVSAEFSFPVGARSWWLVGWKWSPIGFIHLREKSHSGTKMGRDSGNSETTFSSRANNLIIVLESGIILDYTFEISRILY